jgi:hypothetical protein
LRYVEKRLIEIDPVFKRRIEAQNISKEDKDKINKDINDFLSDINS